MALKEKFLNNKTGKPKTSSPFGDSLADDLHLSHQKRKNSQVDQEACLFYSRFVLGEFLEYLSKKSFVGGSVNNFESRNVCNKRGKSL